MLLRLKALIRRIEAVLRRPVTFGAVLLTYVGIFCAMGITGYSFYDRHQDIKAVTARVDAEGVKRGRQFCDSIKREHRAARQDVKNEELRLEQSIDYVRDAPGGENADLVQRVRGNLPVVRRDVRHARQTVRATRPPAICHLPKYQQEKK